LLVEPDVGAPGVERGGEAGLVAPGAVEVVRHHLDVVNVPANKITTNVYVKYSLGETIVFARSLIYTTVINKTKALVVGIDN